MNFPTYILPVVRVSHRTPTPAGRELWELWHVCHGTEEEKDKKWEELAQMYSTVDKNQKQKSEGVSWQWVREEVRHWLNCDTSACPKYMPHFVPPSLTPIICVSPNPTSVYQPCLLGVFPTVFCTYIHVPNHSTHVYIPSTVGWSQRHSLHYMVSWGTVCVRTVFR